MAIFNLTANSAFYAEIWDFAAGNRWNGTAMAAPGTIASSDWATGMVALSELLTSDSGNTGVYAFAAPTGLPKGGYLVAVHSVNTFEPIVNAAALMEFTYDGAAEDANTKAVVAAAISDASLATTSTQTAIKTQTDKLGFDSAGNVKSSPQTAATLAANQHVIVDSGTVTSVISPVTVGTNSDKSGYSLSATGLDAIAATPSTSAISGWSLRDWMAWLVRRFAQASKSETALTTMKADGSTLTTQTVASDTTDVLNEPTLPA